jgi:hypothetical protein
MTSPAHPPGGRVRVVAELLCHPANAAADAELLHSAADCHGRHVSSRASGSCSPEQNSAWPRASFMVIWATAIWVAVGISHHSVLLVSRL